MLVICTIAPFGKDFLRSEEAKQSIFRIPWEVWSCNASKCSLVQLSLKGKESYQTVKHLMLVRQNCSNKCYSENVMKFCTALSNFIAKHWCRHQFSYWPVKDYEVMTIHANNNTEIVKRRCGFNTNERRILYLPIACFPMDSLMMYLFSSPSDVS